jgi:Xaa-Pro aminopeptidase
MAKLSGKQHQDYLKKLKDWMQKNSVGALHISGFDPHINEYTPKEDNFRFYFTGFTGSTAEVLVTASGDTILFVDGRYHLQADQEVLPLGIKVYKCQSGESNIKALVNYLKDEVQLETLYTIGERCSYQYAEFFQQFVQLQSVRETDIWALVDPLTRTLKEVDQLEQVYWGQSTKDKIAKADLAPGLAMYLSALDDIAWLTNLRGYQLDFSSTFYAKALLTSEKVYLFFGKNTPLNSGLVNQLPDEIETIITDDAMEKIAEILGQNHFQRLEVDRATINLADFKFLEQLNSIELVIGRCLIQAKARKHPLEVKLYEDSFSLGNRAIQNTIEWVKSSVEQEKGISERDLFNQTTKEYQKMGALEQSFHTISGVGENGAIVHYSNPSDTRIIDENDLILLDSGGYFKAGVATDTTRTFLASEAKVSQEKLAKYRKYYTLTLRSQIGAESAVFPSGTIGKVIDYQARRPLYEQGVSFSHGLGHGVGVLVHEDGVRLGPGSDLPLVEGHIVSIEPGLYFEGEFGIRLENVAVVEKHPCLEGMLYFRPLVWIPWEEALIDRSLLDASELKYLDFYQTESKKRLNLT